MSCLQQVSSGTEGETRYEMVDEKRKRRMISNRESARRSRMRKQQRMEDLIRECDQLKRSNNEIIAKLDGMKQGLTPIESENNVLRAQVAELAARLDYLNTISTNLEMATAANRASPTIPNNGGILNAGPNFSLNTMSSNLEIAAAASITSPTTPNNGGILNASPNFSYPTFDELQQDFGGFLMDDDPLLRPWQSSFSSQPIMASAGMFQF